MQPSAHNGTTSLIEDVYCCIGTGKEHVRKAVDNILDDGDTSLFHILAGDWSFYLYKDRKLCFARDVFARKSLCWRRRKADDSRWSFELSVFPGEIDAGWTEVEPGTFYLIDCGFLFDVDHVQAKPNTYLPETLSDTAVDFSCTLSSDAFHTVTVYSHFPQSSEDQLLKLFSTVDYHYLDSTSLLMPTTRLIPPEDVDDLLQTTASEFTARLEASVRKALTSVEGGCAVPVLFSGGVDSLMVAILAGRVLSEPTQVALINVAFGDTVEACSEAPDRQRCLEAFKYLRSIDSKYRLLLVNVTKEELVRCREEFIARAVAPLNSVLDDSLGCVLWFASRAQGVEFVTERQEGMNGHAQTRPMPGFLPFTLAGSGSDEQLGGYSRHRSRFQNDGYEGLAAELHMEMCRIGRRNFGRDDRVTSSNGRPALAPFLDEDFVRWLSAVPLQIKVDYAQPRGVGEKRLLRRALADMGVPESLYSAPKQAMQFGSRIAKLENRKEKASDRCQRLLGQTAGD